MAFEPIPQPPGPFGLDLINQINEKLAELDDRISGTQHAVNALNDNLDRIMALLDTTVRSTEMLRVQLSREGVRVIDLQSRVGSLETNVSRMKRS